MCYKWLVGKRVRPRFIVVNSTAPTYVSQIPFGAAPTIPPSWVAINSNIYLSYIYNWRQIKISWREICIRL